MPIIPTLYNATTFSYIPPHMNTTRDEQRLLRGARVLVPRQRDQARDLVARLEALGAQVVVSEVTHVVSAGDDWPATLVPRLSEHRWIVFASANAVRFTLAAVGEPPAWGSARLAAVGDATAAALRAHGLKVELVPDDKRAAGLARALIAADPGVVGAHVLVPRAAEGREELAQALTAAGVHVTEAVAYRTVAASVAELGPLLARLAAADLDILTFFAPSQVAALVDALAEHLGGQGSAVTLLNRARLIAAIGPTTADALRQRGLRVDVIPTAPSAELLVAALCSTYPPSHPEVP